MNEELVFILLVPQSLKILFKDLTNVIFKTEACSTYSTLKHCVVCIIKKMSKKRFKK